MAAPGLKREDTLECAICLQPCMHPVQLPCSHVFCFLCAKVSRQKIAQPLAN